MIPLTGLPTRWPRKPTGRLAEPTCLLYKWTCRGHRSTCRVYQWFVQSEWTILLNLYYRSLLAWISYKYTPGWTITQWKLMTHELFNPLLPVVTKINKLLTLMLVVANLANTEWCKIAEKWLKPWHMDTHLEAFSESYPMNTNKTGFIVFEKLCILCFLEESSLSIGRVNICSAQH